MKQNPDASGEWTVLYCMQAGRTDVRREGYLPFFPVAGMLIDCGDGDYRKVNEVMWHTMKKEVEVWFDNDERGWNFVRMHGWRKMA